MILLHVGSRCFLLGGLLPVQLNNPPLDFLIELGIPDLIDDGVVVGFVNCENTVTLGASQFLHDEQN